MSKSSMVQFPLFKNDVEFRLISSLQRNATQWKHRICKDVFILEQISAKKKPKFTSQTNY